jgi:hypothetical protein
MEMQQVGVDFNELRAQPRRPLYLNELTIISPTLHVRFVPTTEVTELFDHVIGAGQQ